MKKQRGVTFKEAFCSLEKKQLHFLSKQTKYRNPLCFHDWINKLILKDNSYCFTLLICGGPCHLSSLKHFHLIHRITDARVSDYFYYNHTSLFLHPTSLQVVSVSTERNVFVRKYLANSAARYHRQEMTHDIVKWTGVGRGQERQMIG